MASERGGLFERQVFPRLSYYVAGIDPEQQIIQLPEQTGVQIVEQKPRDTVCLALAASYISLFAAMLLLCSSIMIAFSSWAIHFKATGSAAAILVCSLFVFFLAFFLILRNVCWPCGPYIAMALLTVLLIGQLIAAIYFAGFADKAVDFVYKHDTIHAERQAIDQGYIVQSHETSGCSCALTSVWLAAQNGTKPIPSDNNDSSAISSDLSREGTLEEERVPLNPSQQSWFPPRANLGQYFHDNLLLIRPICWIAVGFQAITLIVLILTHRRMKKLQIFERIGAISR